MAGTRGLAVPIARNNGLDIHYQVTGTGMPVVLLHSFLCSGQMWEGQVGPLADSHRVVNVDARGHGRSSRVGEAFPWDATADDVLAVLDAEGIGEAVWVGLSMGGMTALHAAVHRPRRVRGLVLLDTNGGVEPARQRLQLKALGAASRLLGIRPLLPVASRQMFGTTTRRARPALVRSWCQRFADVDVPSAVHVLNAFLGRQDLSDRLEELRVPTLVAVGAEDHAQPPPRARRIAAQIPHARYLEIPEAGHLSAVEQPAVVTEAILEFLRRLPNAG